MLGFLLRALIVALGLWLATVWVNGVSIDTPGTLILAGVLLGITVGMVALSVNRGQCYPYPSGLSEVFIGARLVWLLGMHDECADHADHFLHRHMRVVEISAFLVKREFIDKAAAGRDRILTRTGRPVHLIRNFETVPVHRGRFGKVIVHDDANSITLVHLNRRPGSAAVVTPEVNDPARKNLLFNRLGNEMEFLNVPVHSPGKLRNIRRFHRNDPTVALGTVAHVVHVHARSVRLLGCKQARCGRQSGAQTKSISQEIASVLHGSSS